MIERLFLDGIDREAGRLPVAEAQESAVDVLADEAEAGFAVGNSQSRGQR